MGCWLRIGVGEHETNLSLLHHIRGAIPLTRFRSCVSDKPHAKGGTVEIRRLTRVAHVKLHVVGTIEGKKIRDGKRRRGGQSHDLPGGRTGECVHSHLLGNKARQRPAARTL